MYKKVGLLLGVFITIIISYNLIGQIINTLKSGDRLQQATEELHKLEIKNRELKKNLEQVKRPDFIERQARDKLGLAREGEVVVVIPQAGIDQVLGLSKKVEEIKLPNWLGWLKLFWY